MFHLCRWTVRLTDWFITNGHDSKLEDLYQVDFQLLRAEARGEVCDESEKKAKAIRGISKAVRRFKERKRLSGENKVVTAQPLKDTKAD